MKFTQTSYGVENTILLNDHFVAIKVPVDNTSTLKNANGIITAGKVYPADDSTAIGIVMHDTDVSGGKTTMAVIVHGFINSAKITAPSANAKAAMKQIYFGTK